MPSAAGVYRFLDEKGGILYVGKANNLKSRVSSYFTSKDSIGEKTRLLVGQIKKIKITIVESELEALLLEAFYIKKFKPKYNVRLADNKSYVRIKITLKNDYPSITLARLEDDPKAVYFGPYPSSSSVKLVLKTIRRIFPFVSVANHAKRICLYNHLGLCPCPQVPGSNLLLRKYKKNIRNIIRILEGQSPRIMRELEKERDELSMAERYEEALEIQTKINALSLITTPYHRPFEYDLNPNLRSDMREKEMKELMQILKNHGLRLESLSRIECYDISNLSGTNATGSMVVFINAEKDGSQYRRFKIIKDGKPNDFAMMSEVLGRRLKHREWNLPDLIVVDGGKGQVSAVKKILAERNIFIPLIGLAKREETIVIPKCIMHNVECKISSFREVSLPKNSPSLHLIMRIRDEAHRFAIAYHKKLRSRAAIFSASHIR